MLPKESGEFFFWVSEEGRVSDNPSDHFDAYSPAPLGNDTFALFGDESALPIFGNFDPPVTGSAEIAEGRTLTNTRNAYDVNDDGNVSPLDALLVINALSRGIDDARASESARMFAMLGSYLDVDANQWVIPLDALRVVNQLAGGAASLIGNAEGESVVAQSSSTVDQAFANEDDEDEEEWFLLDLELDRMGRS